jgi:hypothetical protein
MLHHARLVQRTFQPSSEDLFHAYGIALESRALVNLGRREDALTLARTLAYSQGGNPDAALIGQNLLVNSLPLPLVARQFRDDLAKGSNTLRKILAARVETDQKKAQGLLTEAHADPQYQDLASRCLLQRLLWEGDHEAALEIAKQIQMASTEQDDFLRLAQADLAWVDGSTPERVWDSVKSLLPQMSEPQHLLLWLVKAAAQIGDLTHSVNLLLALDFQSSFELEQEPPTALYWKCKVLLAQGAIQDASRVCALNQSGWDHWGRQVNLETALAARPPHQALALFETYLSEASAEMEVYRLAGYHLARECGLDEIARQILTPYAKAELGSRNRVIWEILEGSGWSPDNLLGFVIQRSPLEINDVVFALALRAQLDGDRRSADWYRKRCAAYPSVMEFPAMMINKGKE